MIHRHAHRKRRLEIRLRRNLVQIRRQRNPTKKDNIIDTIQNVQRWSMRHHRVAHKHKSQPDITERQHLPLAVLIHQLAHRRRSQRNQRLIHQHQNHRRMHGHPVYLHQSKNRKRNKHLLPHTLQKIQRIIQTIPPLKHKTPLVGWPLARRKQNGKTTAHSSGTRHNKQTIVPDKIISQLTNQNRQQPRHTIHTAQLPQPLPLLTLWRKKQRHRLLHRDPAVKTHTPHKRIHRQQKNRINLGISHNARTHNHQRNRSDNRRREPHHQRDKKRIHKPRHLAQGFHISQLVRVDIQAINNKIVVKRQLHAKKNPLRSNRKRQQTKIPIPLRNWIIQKTSFNSPAAPIHRQK